MSGPIESFVPHPTQLKQTWAPAMAHLAGEPRGWQRGLELAIVDVALVEAVKRLASGPIDTWEHLEAAELAVRALVLHQHVHVLVPGVLVTEPEGWTWQFYVSPPEPVAMLDVWRAANVFHRVVFRDWVRSPAPDEPLQSIISDPFWSAQENDFRRSALSALASHERKRAKERILWRCLEETPLGAGFVATPATVGAAAYFADDRLRLLPRSDRGIDQPHARIADALYRAWRARFPAAAAIGVPIGPGPFLAIVLSRASTRDQIPLVIQELRAQLVDPWREVWRRMDVLREIPNPDHVERESAKVLRAVEAVVPHATPARYQAFRWLSGLGAAAKDIDVGAPLRSAAKRLGGSALGAIVQSVLDWRSVNSLEATKMLAQDLQELDGFVPSLRRLLTRAELQALHL